MRASGLREMPRAAFVFRPKEQLMEMGTEELLGYIATLRSRITYLHGVGNKQTKKALEVAEGVLKLRESP
jgi:hypothetical protein